MGDSVCRSDDAAAGVLRGDVCGIGGQRRQVPGDVRIDRRGVQRLQPRDCAHAADQGAAAQHYPGDCRPGRPARFVDRADCCADPAASGADAWGRRARGWPSVDPAGEPEKHRKPGTQGVAAADRQAAGGRAAHHGLAGNRDPYRHPVSQWGGPAGGTGQRGAAQSRVDPRAVREPAAGGGLYRRCADQYLDLPVQLGAVGGARGNRGATFFRARCECRSSRHHRLGRNAPGRRQCQRGRPQPQSAGAGGGAERSQRTEPVLYGCRSRR